MKKEKENLIKLCSQLKIEVNRLENNLSIAQNVIEEANNMNYVLNENIGDESEINYNEINDIKKKTQELIEAKPFDKKHFIEPSKIKQQAIDKIEKVMREKIPDNLYKMEESNANIDNNYENYDDFNNVFKEENKEMESNSKDSLNAQKLKLLKRTKRK